MRVAVVGGGIQGVGIALELSTRGVDVDLFEKRSGCLTEASLRNEGKIHLGFVYANDRTMATARTMALGAAHFERILSRWLERDLRHTAIPHPFNYFVHKDSLLSADDLAAYYKRVTAINCEAREALQSSYLGADPCEPVVRMGSSAQGLADERRVAAVFRTPEIAVDPETIAMHLIERAKADPRITFHLETEVNSVVHDATNATVTFTSAEALATSKAYDHVINASWEGLLAIDSTAGVPSAGAWSFRIKHYVRLRVHEVVKDICSATIVLGAFGDVVRFASGDIFLSWYPVGRLGICSGLRPPPWPRVLPPDRAADVRTGIFEALCNLMPGLRALQTSLHRGELHGGVIFALGNTDVDDPASRLHERHSVGPRSFGRYHSVNTGKYTLAPMFAMQLADRIVCPAAQLKFI